MLLTFPKRISPLLQSDQLPIISEPDGFRFGWNICSLNSAKARFIELSKRSLKTWSDSFFSFSFDQLFFAQFSRSLLSKSLNLFVVPLKYFSNRGSANEIFIPWCDFLAEFWFLLSHSKRLSTALTLDLLNRIAAWVHASTRPMTSDFVVGSEAGSTGIWLLITPLDVLAASLVNTKEKDR